MENMNNIEQQVQQTSVQQAPLQESQLVFQQDSLAKSAKKKSKAKIIIIVALIVVLVAALAVGGWLLFNSKEKSEKLDWRENRIFTEGLVCVRIGNKWGYADEKGNMKIEAQFDDAIFFSEGLAAVCKDNRWGFINKKGKYVIEPQFDSASWFSEELALVKKDDKWIYIDKKGKTIIEHQYAGRGAFIEGVAVVVNNGKYGYINKKSEVVIQPQYDKALPFTPEGLATVTKDGKYMCINKKGETIVSGYDYIGYFNQGLAPVQLGDKWGYINPEGEIIIDIQFDNAGEFSSYGLASVSKKGKWGAINIKGEYEIEPNYSYMMSIFTSKGYTYAVNEGVIVSLKETISVKERDYYVGTNTAGASFSVHGFIYMDKESGKIGILDEEGNIKTKAQFDEIKLHSSEYYYYSYITNFNE